MLKNACFSLAVLAIVVAVGCASAADPTYRVGANREHKSLSELVAQLKPGDVVEVDPGVYHEAMKIKAGGTATQPVIIRGVPGKPRPVFDATGVNVSGVSKNPRAIFQIEAPYIVLEHIEATNARNGDTAAAVRLNGSTNATIRDCYLHHNDLGVFGNDEQTATIDSCEVAFNSTEKWNGYAHNFYMHGNRVVVRNSYIHDCPFGQNFKSRAHYNELWYNWIADSNEGEVGPVDEHTRSKLINTGLPNSNTLLVGNAIVSRPRKDGNPSKFILFGAELKGGESTGHNGTLYLFNNTFVAESDKMIFIQLADAKANLFAANNIFAGSDHIFGTVKSPAAGVAGTNNLIPPSASQPDGWTGTIKAAPRFVDAAKRDFRLQAGSPAIDAGTDKISYVDGDGKEHLLLGEVRVVLGAVGEPPQPVPVSELTRSPWPHMMSVPRQVVGRPDLGAYESNAAPPPATQPGGRD